MHVCKQNITAGAPALPRQAEGLSSHMQLSWYSLCHLQKSGWLLASETLEHAARHLPTHISKDESSFYEYKGKIKRGKNNGI